MITLSDKRINEAVSKVFAEYPEPSMIAGEGVNAAFRFLADNVVSALNDPNPDMEAIYCTLYARMCFAKAGLPQAEWADNEKQKLAITSFRLGLMAGKTVNAQLRKRIIDEEPAPMPFDEAGVGPGHTLESVFANLPPIIQAPTPAA